MPIEVEDFTKTIDNWSRGQKKYPWESCKKPGLGFRVYDRTIQQVSAACAGTRQVKFKGWKFSCKTIKATEDEPKYIRVIRIE